MQELTSGIYSSTDDGKSWTLEESGLQINIFSMANSQIFAAPNQGVLASNDYGRTWNWLYKERAIYTRAVNKNESIMDFHGTVLDLLFRIHLDKSGCVLAISLCV